jgi:hypothetical protein
LLVGSRRIYQYVIGMPFVKELIYGTLDRENFGFRITDLALIKLTSFFSRVIRHPVAKHNVASKVGIPVLNDLVVVSRYSRDYCFQIIGLLTLPKVSSFGPLYIHSHRLKT